MHFASFLLEFIVLLMEQSLVCRRSELIYWVGELPQKHLVLLVGSIEDGEIYFCESKFDDVHLTADKWTHGVGIKLISLLE